MRAMIAPARAVAWRAFAGARVRTISFALLFFAYALAQGLGYQQEFPTAADREAFAQIGDSPALRVLYGMPRELTTVGGYVDWRVGGVTSVVAAFFGLLSGVRAFRGEEEAGRHELVLSGTISRVAVFWARTAAIGATLAVLWLAVAVGLVAGGLAPGGSARLALGVAAVAAVYAGVGALTSQLAPTGRGALELGGVVAGLDFLTRVIADSADRPALHWLTPLGWMEELRAFVDPRPLVLLPLVVVAVTLLGIAQAFDRTRDVGHAWFAPRDTRDRPRLGLLRSPTLLALRMEGATLLVWVVATGGFGLALGGLAATIDFSEFGNVQAQVSKFGADLATPSGVIALYFLFFLLAIALFCCGQLAAARAEEAEGRLETLFAQPQGRVAWLGGRLGLAAAGSLLLGVAAGLGAALGATVAGADVSFPRLIEAGLNCLPASLLFLGVGALLVAAVPRVGVGAAYALVGVAFVWELVGALLGAPSWLLGISPFHQIGLVPAAPFRAVPAAVMLLIGGVAAALALLRFRGRDLAGA